MARRWTASPAIQARACQGEAWWKGFAAPGRSGFPPAVAMHFLGIEIGHAATRVVALDLEAARVAAESVVALGWIEGLPEGYREQDPVTWIGAVDRGVREVLAQLGESRATVAGIGITAPPGGMVV